MALIFVLCFNAFSSEHINTNEGTVKLDWYSDRIVYHNGENDNSIPGNYLDLTVDVSENFYLYIDILESRQCDLQINLTSQKEISYATIFVNTELEIINIFKKLTVYSNVPISFYNPKYIRFFFQSYNKDGLLTNNYFPYDNDDKTMICYMSDKCASLTKIQTNNIYYSFLNKSGAYYEQNNYTTNITIYFDDDHSDVPYFFIRSDNSENLIYLIGLKESPSQISFANSDNNKINFLFIQNIQFTKCFLESEMIIFECYIIDTYDVFPSSCNLDINSAYENRKNTKQSPFKNDNYKISYNTYNIFLELEKNGDLIFQFAGKSINILNNKNEEIITVPLNEDSDYSDDLILDGQKNPKNNTITIDIVDVPEFKSFSFLNCDQIPIEFSDKWNSVDSKSVFIFKTSNKNDILMKPPNNENINILIYETDINEEDIYDRLYYQYPINSYILYTTLDEDDYSEMTNKKHIETIEDIYNFIDSHQNVETITLILDSKYNEQELDFTSHLYNNNFYLNIYYFDITNPISLTLKSPEGKQIDLEIRNCNVNILDAYVKNINLIDNSTIINNEENAKITHIYYADLRSNDAILKLHENNYEIGDFVCDYDSELRLKANSLNHWLKIEFDANVNESKINILTSDNLAYLPIDIKEDYDEPKKVEIVLFAENGIEYNMASNVIYKTLPKRTYVLAYYKTSLDREPICISQICPENLAEGIFITYTDKYLIQHCDKCFSFDAYNFLVKNDDEFEKIMKMIESITSSKATEQMIVKCFFLLNEKKIKFQLIPKNIQHVYLYKYTSYFGDKYYLHLLLADDVDVSSIDYFIFENYIKFKVDPNANKIFRFNNLVVDYQIFNCYDLNKIKIKKAYWGLFIAKYSKSSNLPYYDMMPFCDKIEATLINNDYNDIIYLIYENGNIVVRSNIMEQKAFIFPNVNEFNDKLYIVSKLSEHRTIVFNITDQTINETNFCLDNESYIVDLNFTCGNDQNSNFKLNLYINKSIEDNITINEGNCNDFLVKNIILYPLDILPTKEFSLSDEFSLSNPFTKSDEFSNNNYFTVNPTTEVVPTQEYVPPLEIENKNTTSDSIILTNKGYITREENENNTTEKVFDDDTSSIKTVTLLLNDVSVSENDDIESAPETPLYLVASLENTKITIKSSVNKTNVGIFSDNSPTIVLEKKRNHVNLMNNGNVKENQITIDVEKIQEDGQIVTELYFKDVENRNGEFNVLVPLNIEIISFVNMIMSRVSTFGVKKYKENKRSIHKLDENEEFVNVQIENSINVNSQALARISNVNLIGTLNIYDDSSLTMNENSNFSEKSEINVVISRSKSFTFDDKPIIYVEHSLKSIPKAINLLLDPNNTKIDISNMPIIASGKFDLCSNLNELVKFQDGKEVDFSTKCENHNDLIIFLLTAKEKEGKKDNLGPGAIAGIVIGCVAAVAIIVAVVVILIRRRRDDASNDENENNSEISEMEI